MERWVVRSRLRNEKSLILSFRTRLQVSLPPSGLMEKLADFCLALDISETSYRVSIALDIPGQDEEAETRT